MSKSVYCKKLKGDHKFVLVDTWKWSLYPDELYKVYKCHGCGKQQQKTIKTK